MKRFLILFYLMYCFVAVSRAQVINAAYAKALHKKYPPQLTDLCVSFKLWVNPYHKSIADIAEHRTLSTYYVYTKEHRLAQEALKVTRSGTYAA